MKRSRMLVGKCEFNFYKKTNVAVARASLDPEMIASITSHCSRNMTPQRALVDPTRVLERSAENK